MKNYNINASREEVAALLNYDPVTGLFTHKVNGHKRKAGNVTGRLDIQGYIRIRLLGYEFKAHRLAWLMTYGVWPKAEIDHINGCPNDNRIMNLRDVTVAVNAQNRKVANNNNKSGLLGVSTVASGFLAQIKVNGTQLRLGVYDNAEEAHAAYLTAKKSLHWEAT